ncbi:hypothetical protein J8L98_23395 [Pseudoalteromonas sp. MMG013]|uniref:hypothetical protein n=1 Tax=Pseudoalteromonas sp. MMG013 TaxID=2822687 RepID=UPI001B3658E5|nr:hypothetical protein [Pseudoalteromonas sp. MMG013]MBQ4864633.1 hypothetical protein [Pseudoalteromonas sp. MMG013]
MTKWWLSRLSVNANWGGSNFMAFKRIIVAVIVIVVCIWFFLDFQSKSTAMPSPSMSKNVVTVQTDNALPPEIRKTTIAAQPQRKLEHKQCDLSGFFNYQRDSARRLAETLGPEFFLFESVINQQLELKVYHQGVINTTFTTKLVTRLRSVHTHYVRMLGQSAVKPIDVNLIIMDSRAAYEDHTSQGGFDPRSSQGVFFHGNNSAFVEYKGDNTTLKTAIHEAVHAINLRLIGSMPRWLNEGLAETFESVNGHSGFDVDYRILNRTPMELYSVLDSETQWGSIDTAQLYFSGWAWVHYMLNDVPAEQALLALLRQEQQNMCVMLSSEQIAGLLEAAHPTIEQAFNQWRMDRLATH